MNEINANTGLILGVVGAFFLLALLAKFIISFQRFSQELRYLNTEIARSKGEHRQYWKQQRRRLWLSLLLF